MLHMDREFAFSDKNRLEKFENWLAFRDCNLLNFKLGVYVSVHNPKIYFV